MKARHLFIFVSCFIVSLASANIIDIQHWKTTQGAPVYFVHNSNVPMLTVRAQFLAGSVYDGKHFGLASLTNNVLVKSAGKYSSEALSDRLANLGINLDNDVDKKAAYISMTLLTKPSVLNAGIDVFKTILGQPNFNTDDINQIKKQTLAAQQAELQDPNTVAGLSFAKYFFKGTPYAHNVLGNPSIEHITKKSLQQFYRQFYTAKNAAFMMVGDISKQKAKQISNKLSEALPNGKKAKPVPLKLTKPGTNILHVDYPSNQTYVVMGKQLPIKINTPRYYQLSVANSILGGSGLTSMLNQVLREQYGLTYAISSNLQPMPESTLLLVTFQTKNAYLNQAIKYAKQTINNFVQNGPSEKALQAKKAYLINSFPLNFSSNHQIIALLSLLNFYQLPLSYFDNYTKNIKQVTLREMINTIRTSLKPDQFFTITVGEKA